MHAEAADELEGVGGAAGGEDLVAVAEDRAHRVQDALVVVDEEHARIARVAGGDEGGQGCVAQGPVGDAEGRLERLGELPRRGEALSRILGEAADEHLVQLGGHVRVEGRGIRGRLAQHLAQDLRGLAVEGPLAGDELVDDDGHLVEVARGRGALAAALLRRHVVQRAQDVPGLGEARGVEARDAEIGNLDAPVVVHEDVGGLEVAVEDTLRMAMGEPVEDLARDVPCVPEIVDRRFLQAQREGLAFHQLHHDAGELVGLDEVVDGGHPRVGDASHGLGLAAEARELGREVARGEGALGHHLERDRALDAFVGAAVDGPRRALAEELAHLVAGDARGDVHAIAPCPASAASSSTGGCTGRVTVKVVPTSTRECTSMRPPCWETIL